MKDADKIFAASFKPTSSNAPRFHDATVDAPWNTRVRKLDFDAIF